MTDLLFMPVEKIPSKDLLPGYDFPSGISNAIIVTQPDGTRRIVQYCSDLYSLVDNRSLIPAFESEISKHWDVELSAKVSNFSRFYVDFIFKGKPNQILKKDDIFPRIRLVNSYDGSIKYHFNMGYYRLICTNGLTVPTGYNKGMKFMHTPSIEEVTSFAAVFEMISEFLSLSDDMVENYHELADAKVGDINGRIEEVIEETDFPTSLQEDVQFRAHSDLNSVFRGQANDWLIYNSFNYQLNHNEDYKAKESKKNELDQQVLQYLLKY